MVLCVRITFSIGAQKGFLRNFVLKHANKLELEGVAQFLESDKVQIIACGKKDIVDNFVDLIHSGTNKYKLDTIELEPFIKSKDYRGIFRVIE